MREIDDHIRLYQTSIKVLDNPNLSIWRRDYGLIRKDIYNQPRDFEYTSRSECDNLIAGLYVITALIKIMNENNNFIFIGMLPINKTGDFKVDQIPTETCILVPVERAPIILKSELFYDSSGELDFAEKVNYVMQIQLDRDHTARISEAVSRLRS